MVTCAESLILHHNLLDGVTQQEATGGGQVGMCRREEVAEVWPAAEQSADMTRTDEN